MEMDASIASTGTPYPTYTGGGIRATVIPRRTVAFSVDKPKSCRFRDNPLYLRLLIFAGVAIPKEYGAPWQCWWYVVRLSVALGLLSSIAVVLQFSGVEMGSLWRVLNDPIVVWLVLVPGFLSNLCAAYAYTWMPKKLKTLGAELRNRDRVLGISMHGGEEELAASSITSSGRMTGLFKSGEEGHYGKKFASYFVVILTSACLILCICYIVFYENFKFKLKAFVHFFALMAACGSTIPVLGALLLVLSVDVSISLKDVRAVKEAAKDKTLTRAVYELARDNIRERSEEHGKHQKAYAVTKLVSQ